MKYKSASGFTLVELIISIVILGVIASITAKVLSSGVDTYAFVSDRHDTFQRARLSMERMVDEISLIDQSGITGIYNDRIDFTDVDGNSANFKRVLAFQDGQSVWCLYRGRDFLSEGISSLEFEYYDSAGNETSYPSDVRMVSMDMNVQSLKGNGSIHLKTKVFLRNYMYTDFQMGS